jgi:hypothetical protein
MKEEYVSAFDVCLRKVERAVQHFVELNETRERFFKEEFNGRYALIGEANTQRTRYRLRAKVLKPFPSTEWGLAIGDGVHCLRSALDQLVYAVLTTPNDRAAFPISKNERDWITEAPKPLWGVPEPFRAVIDRAQPYHARKFADAHPISELAALSNCDKHKAIPVTALVSAEGGELRAVNMRGIANQPSIVLKPGRVFKDGAVVATAKIVADDSGLEPYMDVEGQLLCDIGFGDDDLIPASLRGRAVIKAFYEGFGRAAIAVVHAFREAGGEPP